jgi:CheY-like chemotaxis protein
MDTGRTVMVVDDDPDIMELVKKIVERSGYMAECVSSGEEVFKRLEGQKPDLILLDVVMPRMDGLEVLTRLKSQPNTSSIPVILLTGNGRYSDVLTGYQMGTDYYISKPFTSAQLLSGINLVLGQEDF